MNYRRLSIVVVVASGTCLAAETLMPASSFDRITDKEKRAVALFEEAGKVIIGPRCLNCHPVDDSPRQGELMRKHEPPVLRGMGGMGPPAMRCLTCHGTSNVDAVPGNAKWFLAPKEMGWIGHSLGQICEQIKDRSRNGDRSLDDLVEHMAQDDLVGWAWNPGGNRTPAPGTQKEFGQLIQAWKDNGAHCPKP
jgi:hypothetical protein